MRAAESVLSAAHAEYLPSVSFHGDYGAVGTNPPQAASTYTLTGTINVPIFAGGRVQGDTEQAHAALNQRKAELEDLRKIFTANLHKSAAGKADVLQTINRNAAGLIPRFRSGVA